MSLRFAATNAALTLLAVLTACSTSAPGLREARIPPAQTYDVRIQPARIPPNPQGAFNLSTATGCDVIYVSKTDTADTVTYAVRATSRMPDLEQCVEKLRSQPGVEALTPLG
ncbi:MAG TPA: hypothetical protein VMK32_06320 [Burkholderiaceae bacterium]|nr:hypothetical protein [Burkholderiaceae bacterium]